MPLVEPARSSTAVRQKALKDSLGVRTATLRGPVPDPVARVTNLGGVPIKSGARAAGMSDLRGGRRTKAVVIGGAK